ncbi:MAG: hypothetical protein FWF08_05600 [Oscillospiraceae bacterium]|nr:hypothetical protein [Oscillospiraceae bacterium]
MEYIRQTIGSSALSGIFEIPPSLRDKKVQVIILPAEDAAPEEAKPKKRPIGFLKDKVPPLPDSFFDPLPEEDLQAWGL